MSEAAEFCLRRVADRLCPPKEDEENQENQDENNKEPKEDDNDETFDPNNDEKLMGVSR